VKTLLALCLSLVFAMTASAASGPVYHVVHFKFKSAAKRAEIRKIEKEFAALEQKIPVIQSIEWGTNISPEKLSQGYTHCWIVKFKNEKNRDAYLVHPEHKKFVNLLLPKLESALVVDFIPKK
jgi:hypothetical protein